MSTNSNEKAEEASSPESCNAVAQRQRLRKVMAGVSRDGPFEAIYHNNRPMFLVKTAEGFKIVESLTFQGKPVIPKSRRQMPYEPYEYYEGKIPERKELFDRVFNEFDLFLDLETNYKEFLAACVLLSYQQEKVRTVPYAFLYGDNESGKTVAATLLKSLVYRPLYGVSIPPADIYGYLGDADSPGCIIEDEAQGLHKDFDKLKIYKAGYKRGAVVPRIQNLEQGRYIKYYLVYGFKALAAEEIPRVKGLVERLILIPMTEGTPKKEWADATDEDLERIRNLRNILLKWRLSTFRQPLPEVQLPVRGRLKELWKPIIRVIAGRPVEKRMLQFLLRLQSERLLERQNTLEGHIVKVVAQLYEKGKPLPFRDIWTALLKDLDGTLTYTPHQMSTPEFGTITKQKVGYRLREVLGGKAQTIRIGEDLMKAYYFDHAKLQRVVKKYGFSNVTKLPSSPIVTEKHHSKKLETEEEEDGRELEVLSQKVSKLSNLVTTKEKLKGFVFELRRNSLHSGEVPQLLFKKLMKKYSIGFRDLYNLSQSGIMKSSVLDGIDSKPGYVAVRWVKDAKIDGFREDS